MTTNEMDLAAELFKVDNNQPDYYRALARAAAELLGVELPPLPKLLPTRPGSVIIATEVRGMEGEWRMILDHNGGWYSAELISGRRYHLRESVTAWTEARVLPAGEKISPRDVRKGDRVRLVLDGGDEVTITVTGADGLWVASRRHAYIQSTIRAAYLLSRGGCQ